MSKRSYNIDGHVYVRADLVRIDEVSMHAHASAVIEAVAAVQLVEPSAIKGRGRRLELTLARSACVFMLYQDGLSWPAIGRILGARDHSTVMSYRKHFETPETDRLVEAARERMKEKGA